MSSSAPAARPLPALAENARLRYATFMALYFAQGIPYGLLSFAVPAWLAMNGKTPAQIAAYSTVALLPWSLKLVVAPLIERFAYLPMGRRRPWLLAGQSGLVLSLLGLTLVPDPLHHLALLAAAVFVVNVFVVMQDVATDSLVIDVVPPAQQGQANGLMWGAKAVGLATSLAVGTALLNHYGFAAALLASAAVIGLILLLPLGLRERPGEKRPPLNRCGSTPTAGHHCCGRPGGCSRCATACCCCRPCSSPSCAKTTSITRCRSSPSSSWAGPTGSIRRSILPAD